MKEQNEPDSLFKGVNGLYSNRKEVRMATRNTPVLQKILEALDDLLPADIDALARLEEKFKDDLLIIAGDIKTVEIYAEELRLSINHPEAAQVLDYIGTGKQAGVSIDQVEDAINTLFPGRFIEP